MVSGGGTSIFQRSDRCVNFTQVEKFTKSGVGEREICVGEGVCSDGNTRFDYCQIEGTIAPLKGQYAVGTVEVKIVQPRPLDKI